MKITSFVIFTCLLANCGLLDAIPSKEAKCDLRPAKNQCTDIRGFKGPSLVVFQSLCATLSATQNGGTSYAEGSTCDSASSLGGCQSSSLDGSKQTNWYYMSTDYPDKTEAKAECAGGQSFVEAQ